MNTLEGICIYCGQTQIVIATDQEDANRQVTEACDCLGAQTREKKEMLKFRLDLLCRDGAGDNGFTAVSDDVYKIITMLGEKVVEGKVNKAVLKVDGTQISIANNGDKITATRSKTVKQGGAIG